MSSDDVARFNVLLEHIDAKVTALAEGQTALIARVDRQDERFDRLEGRFDRLELKVDKIAADLADATGRIGRIEHHVGLNGAPTRKRPARKRPRKH